MITVTSPAANQRLTTAAKVMEALELSAGGEDDEFVDSLVDQVSAAICAWCGRTFALETVREVLYRGSASTGVMLGRWPIVAVNCLTIGGTAVDVALTELESGGFLYQIDSNSSRASMSSGRTVIEYNAGFKLPGEDGRNLPHDLERAAIAQAVSWYHQRRNPLVRSTDIVGVSATEYFSSPETGLNPDVIDLIFPYKVVVWEAA